MGLTFDDENEEKNTLQDLNTTVSKTLSFPDYYIAKLTDLAKKYNFTKHTSKDFTTAGILGIPTGSYSYNIPNSFASVAVYFIFPLLDGDVFFFYYYKDDTSMNYLKYKGLTIDSLIMNCIEDGEKYVTNQFKCNSYEEIDYLMGSLEVFLMFARDYIDGKIDDSFRKLPIEHQVEPKINAIKKYYKEHIEEKLPKINTNVTESLNFDDEDLEDDSTDKLKDIVNEKIDYILYFKMNVDKLLREYDLNSELRKDTDTKVDYRVHLTENKEYVIRYENDRLILAFIQGYEIEMLPTIGGRIDDVYPKVKSTKDIDKYIESLRFYFGKLGTSMDFNLINDLVEYFKKREKDEMNEALSFDDEDDEDESDEQLKNSVNKALDKKSIQDVFNDYIDEKWMSLGFEGTKKSHIDGSISMTFVESIIAKTSKGYFILKLDMMKFSSGSTHVELSLQSAGGIRTITSKNIKSSSDLYPFFERVELSIESLKDINLEKTIGNNDKELEEIVDYVQDKVAKILVRRDIDRGKIKIANESLEFDNEEDDDSVDDLRNSLEEKIDLKDYIEFKCISLAEKLGFVESSDYGSYIYENNSSYNMFLYVYNFLDNDDQDLLEVEVNYNNIFKTNNVNMWQIKAALGGVNVLWSYVVYDRASTDFYFNELENILAEGKRLGLENYATKTPENIQFLKEFAQRTFDRTMQLQHKDDAKADRTEEDYEITESIELEDEEKEDSIEDLSKRVKVDLIKVFEEDIDKVCDSIRKSSKSLMTIIPVYDKNDIHKGYGVSIYFKHPYDESSRVNILADLGYDYYGNTLMGEVTLFDSIANDHKTYIESKININDKEFVNKGLILIKNMCSLVELLVNPENRQMPVNILMKHFFNDSLLENLSLDDEDKEDNEETEIENLRNTTLKHFDLYEQFKLIATAEIKKHGNTSEYFSIDNYNYLDSSEFIILEKTYGSQSMFKKTFDVMQRLEGTGIVFGLRGALWEKRKGMGEMFLKSNDYLLGVTFKDFSDDNKKFSTMTFESIEHIEYIVKTYLEILEFFKEEIKKFTPDELANSVAASRKLAMAESKRLQGVNEELYFDDEDENYDLNKAVKKTINLKNYFIDSIVSELEDKGITRFGSTYDFDSLSKGRYRIVELENRTLISFSFLNNIELKFVFDTDENNSVSTNSVYSFLRDDNNVLQDLWLIVNDEKDYLMNLYPENINDINTILKTCLLYIDYADKIHKGKIEISDKDKNKMNTLFLDYALNNYDKVKVNESLSFDDEEEVQDDLNKSIRKIVEPKDYFVYSLVKELKNKGIKLGTPFKYEKLAKGTYRIVEFGKDEVKVEFSFIDNYILKFGFFMNVVNNEKYIQCFIRDDCFSVQHLWMIVNDNKEHSQNAYVKNISDINYVLKTCFLYIDYATKINNGEIVVNKGNIGNLNNAFINYALNNYNKVKVNEALSFDDEEQENDIEDLTNSISNNIDKESYFTSAIAGYLEYRGATQYKNVSNHYLGRYKIFKKEDRTCILYHFTRRNNFKLCMSYSDSVDKGVTAYFMSDDSIDGLYGLYRDSADIKIPKDLKELDDMIKLFFGFIWFATGVFKSDVGISVNEDLIAKQCLMYVEENMEMINKLNVKDFFKPLDESLAFDDEEEEDDLDSLHNKSLDIIEVTTDICKKYIEDVLNRLGFKEKPANITLKRSDYPALSYYVISDNYNIFYNLRTKHNTLMITLNIIYEMFKDYRDFDEMDSCLKFDINYVSSDNISAACSGRQIPLYSEKKQNYYRYNGMENLYHILRLNVVKDVANAAEQLEYAIKFFDYHITKNTSAVADNEYWNGIRQKYIEGLYNSSSMKHISFSEPVSESLVFDDEDKENDDIDSLQSSVFNAAKLTYDMWEEYFKDFLNSIGYKEVSYERNFNKRDNYPPFVYCFDSTYDNYVTIIIQTKSNRLNVNLRTYEDNDSYFSYSVHYVIIDKKANKKAAREIPLFADSTEPDNAYQWIPNIYGITKLRNIKDLVDVIKQLDYTIKFIDSHLSNDSYKTNMDNTFWHNTWGKYIKGLQNRKYLNSNITSIDEALSFDDEDGTTDVENLRNSVAKTIDAKNYFSNTVINILKSKGAKKIEDYGITSNIGLGEFSIWNYKSEYSNTVSVIYKVNEGTYLEFSITDNYVSIMLNIPNDYVEIYGNADINDISKLNECLKNCMVCIEFGYNLFKGNIKTTNLYIEDSLKAYLERNKDMFTDEDLDKYVSHIDEALSFDDEDAEADIESLKNSIEDKTEITVEMFHKEVISLLHSMGFKKTNNNQLKKISFEPYTYNVHASYPEEISITISNKNFTFIVSLEKDTSIENSLYEFSMYFICFQYETSETMYRGLPVKGNSHSTADNNMPYKSGNIYTREDLYKVFSIETISDLHKVIKEIKYVINFFDNIPDKDVNDIKTIYSKFEDTIKEYVKGLDDNSYLTEGNKHFLNSSAVYEALSLDDENEDNSVEDLNGKIANITDIGLWYSSILSSITKSRGLEEEHAFPISLTMTEGKYATTLLKDGRRIFTIKIPTSYSSNPNEHPTSYAIVFAYENSSRKFSIILDCSNNNNEEIVTSISNIKDTDKIIRYIVKYSLVYLDFCFDALDGKIKYSTPYPRVLVSKIVKYVNENESKYDNVDIDSYLSSVNESLSLDDEDSEEDDTVDVERLSNKIADIFSLGIDYFNIKIKQFLDRNGFKEMQNEGAYNFPYYVIKNDWETVLECIIHDKQYSLLVKFQDTISFSKDKHEYFYIAYWGSKMGRYADKGNAYHLPIKAKDGSYFGRGETYRRDMMMYANIHSKEELLDLIEQLKYPIEFFGKILTPEKAEEYYKPDMYTLAYLKYFDENYYPF